MRRRTIALTSVALFTATLLLTGCAQDTSTGGTPGMDHGSAPMTPPLSATTSNSADQMFLTMMIPHHEQAIEMADAILGKDGVDPRVTALAQQIKDAQDPEIETMKSWLTDWGMPYDDATSSGMGSMDPADGMMPEEDMAALAAATGTEATRLFLEGMIDHHLGAVEMAQSVMGNGQNPALADLAEQIIDAQTAEIATMREILDSL